jgi:hypothetical protein
MGLEQKLEGITAMVKGSAQNSALKVTTISLRVITSIVLSYTLALIAQEIMDFGNFALLFILVVFAAVFYRISKNWSLMNILVFGLICALVFQILKMYILLAP